MIGAVVIGRNEGQRLISCLESLVKHIDRVVYVDSGSTDNSLVESENRNIECLSLDMSISFTAARARNEGANYLIHKYPDLQFIQFIDGDCEIQPDWISKAQDFLENHNQYAVVCGRRRERYPENSVYNQLCDIEWNTPVGEALACGGDALIRIEAFKQVSGYREGLIAGEEPEMCFRLRTAGWKIFRLDDEMTLHDAAMLSIFQWWKRAKRAGYAYANGYYLHGSSIERFKKRELVSIVVWSIFIPFFIAINLFLSPLLIILVVIYPIQVVRIALKPEQCKIESIKLRLLYASSHMLAKFPQFSGVVSFFINKYNGRSGKLIEYK